MQKLNTALLTIITGALIWAVIDNRRHTPVGRYVAFAPEDEKGKCVLDTSNGKVHCFVSDQGLAQVHIDLPQGTASRGTLAVSEIAPPQQAKEEVKRP